MNQSHSRNRHLSVIICLAVASAVQLGCRTETSAPEVVTAKNVTPETPAAKKAVQPPTEPASKTEVAADPQPEFVNAHFEAPFRLMVDNDPLNTAAGQMYPSPAMFDVDNDGQSELIVGDIFGSLNVYENKSDGNGDPVWSSHYALKTGGGEAIKVSNW